MSCMSSILTQRFHFFSQTLILHQPLSSHLQYWELCSALSLSIAGVVERWRSSFKLLAWCEDRDWAEELPARLCDGRGTLESMGSMVSWLDAVLSAQGLRWRYCGSVNAITFVHATRRRNQAFARAFLRTYRYTLSAIIHVNNDN
jgi:hypothetical protein